MSAQAIAFKDDLARARVVAAERRKALEEAPELTAEEIKAAFTQELRSTAVKGFGRVYYYHPMGADESMPLREILGEATETTAALMVKAVIIRARNSDGSLKFTTDDAAWLVRSPAGPLTELASTVVQSRGFSVASAEKK